ncbi:hypothetical protein MRX96_009676 [Rhipicephalus microplus]
MARIRALHPGQTQGANGMNPNNRGRRKARPLGADNNACPNDERHQEPVSAGVPACSKQRSSRRSAQVGAEEGARPRVSLDADGAGLCDDTRDGETWSRSHSFALFEQREMTAVRRALNH